MVQLVRKISAGAVNNVKKGFKGIKEKQLMMRIAGVVSGVKQSEHPQYGPYQEFTGEFRAFNKEGEEFAAPKAFLPAPVDTMLKEAWENGGKGNVQFGFDIFVVPDEGSERGYQYRVETLMESKPSDPLAALLKGLPPAQFKPSQPALPGVGADPQTGELTAEQVAAKQAEEKAAKDAEEKAAAEKAAAEKAKHGKK